MKILICKFKSLRITFKNVILLFNNCTNIKISENAHKIYVQNTLILLIYERGSYTI